MSADEFDAADLPMWAIDEIWEQWKQCNDLCPNNNVSATGNETHGDANLPPSNTEVFDAQFKYVYEVPSHLVVHTPSARLNITRLVACRNYIPHQPDSCMMARSCKFVHADVDYSTLEARPIHVNYIWRHEDLCTYERLPPGEMVEVLKCDMSTVEFVRSELILVTRGALARHDNAEPLMRCSHFEANQTCFIGDRCNYVHVAYIDKNVQGSFRRAPRMQMITKVAAGDVSSSNISKGATRGVREVAAVPDPNAFMEGCLKSQKVHTSQLQDTNRLCFEPHFAAHVARPATLNPTVRLKQPVSHYQVPAHSPKGDGAPPGRSISALQPHSSHSACMEDTSATFSGPLSDAVDGSYSGQAGQGQFNALLSKLASIVAQRAANERRIITGASPMLDEPQAAGTLLFLPRGATEAVALQPVFDYAFLNTVISLGAQQAHPVFSSSCSLQQLSEQWKLCTPPTESTLDGTPDTFKNISSPGCETTLRPSVHLVEAQWSHSALLSHMARMQRE
ncbi:hypothetical protein ERJ75_000017100 [Trypanosoma vivax]|uniref:C3H1-type domain-containing protein n=1 Tax=Trypanosoma vivax (strain Y486) TaxID=1055687 RepID=G0U434_TRYVY|nr:hypothetical protein ERJ75_000017100 [Trypanosoma vivax]CCC52196.1 conserved hypothetical protein [Trypanosoma vivax Y486]